MLPGTFSGKAEGDMARGAVEWILAVMDGCSHPWQFWSFGLFMDGRRARITCVYGMGL